MFNRFFKSKGDKGSKRKGKEISLIVGDGLSEKPFVVKIPKRLLMEHSAVFRKMADNGDFKKSREVKLEEITVTGLQKIAEYILNDSTFFKTHYEAIETLKAAYIYQIQAMTSVCSDFLTTIIDSGNVCEIYEFASNFSIYTLEYNCLKFIDENAEDILKSPAFLTLKKATALNIIKRHSLNIQSEILIFRAVLTWGLNDCLRRGVDAEQADDLMASVKPLLERVKFLTMTKEELMDPDVDKFYKMLHSEESVNKRKSLLNLEMNSSLERRSRSSTLDSSNIQSRRYEKEYIHDFDVYSSDNHPVKNGESFCLRIEILKGKLFLAAVTLGFDTFVTSKNTACLCVALTATNIQTFEQKSIRGTFLNTGDEAELKFPTPLLAKETEFVEITLNVKRVENICPLLLKSDIQIAMPETKEVAMKITPTVSTDGNERGLFKNIKYFF